MATALVACSKRKLSHPAPARDLYQGTLFRLSRYYVERRYDTWYILSARHGLVRPGRVLSPYDVYLGNFSADERRRWAEDVLESLEQRGELTPRCWWVLAGLHYRRHLVPHLPGEVVIPLEGMSLGEQLAWLKERQPGGPRRTPQAIYDDLTVTVLSLVETCPGIWTAALCRRMNGVPETEEGVVHCGLCKDYANPRKRERAERYARHPTLPGMTPPYQLHVPCTVGLRQVRGMLRKLREVCLMVVGRREIIPDSRNNRGWDLATRWYPLD